MYSPKISEEFIPYLYQWAKSEGVSMTALVNRMIKNEIENNQRKEKKSNDEKDKRNPQFGILEIFKSGQIPEAVSYAAFPSFDIPSEQWSYLNRIIMWLNGTYDARGYRQWEEAGRHVKKGATAFHIFAPRLVKEKKENGEEDFSLLGLSASSGFLLRGHGGRTAELQENGDQFIPLD